MGELSVGLVTEPEEEDEDLDPADEASSFVGLFETFSLDDCFTGDSFRSFDLLFFGVMISSLLDFISTVRGGDVAMVGDEEADDGPIGSDCGGGEAGGGGGGFAPPQHKMSTAQQMATSKITIRKTIMIQIPLVLIAGAEVVTVVSFSVEFRVVRLYLIVASVVTGLLVVEANVESITSIIVVSSVSSSTRPTA